MQVTTQLFKNAVLSICQVIFTGLSYFIVFKIILNNLDKDALGVFTLVFSFSSVANIANLGISNSLVKFIAEAYFQKDYKRINSLFQVGLIIVCVFMTAVESILWLTGDYLLSKVISLSQMDMAVSILPFSLLCLLLNTISGIFLSVLDAMLLTYIKNLIFIGSNIFFLSLCYILINSYGLIGVCYSMLSQSIFVLILSIFGLYKYFPAFSPFKIHWDKFILKEIFNYSLKFQIISLLALLTDPITKFMLSYYGSVSNVGFYEMANRLVLQVRQLIVTANQTIIPIIAQRSSDTDEVVKMHQKIFYLISIVTFPLMCFMIIQSSLICYLWIGNVEMFFLHCFWSLILGYTINILSGPAYFSNLGTGTLNPILKSHLLLSLGNVILGFSLGSLFGGYGVLAGWTMALCLSSCLTLFLFRKQYNKKIKDTYNNSFIALALLYTVFILISILSVRYVSNIFSAFLMTSTISITFLLGLIILNMKYTFLNIVIDFLRNDKYSNKKNT
jgi:O-antigen/teichoic acid export membrane protein